MPEPEHTRLQSRLSDETGVRVHQTPRTLLDALIDRLETGLPVTLYIVEPACQHPYLAPSTSYSRGCRCPECRDAHNHAVHRRRSRHHTRELAQARARHPSARTPALR
jgi:hypothetical protein